MPVTFGVPNSHIRPMNFTRRRTLVPCPLGAFHNCHCLRRCFTFRSGFLFISIGNLSLLGTLPRSALGRIHKLRLHFSVHGDNVRHLHPALSGIGLCYAPVIGLFGRSTLPVHLSNGRSRCLLLPTRCSLRGYNIFSIRAIAK